MIRVCFLVVGWLSLLLAMHPFIFYPLSLILLKRRPSHAGHPASAVRSPKQYCFAVCMCAYNEQAVIEAKAKNLLVLQKRHPDLEVFIYVDGSTDETVNMLLPYSEFFKVIVSESRHGKTYGMNQLVASSSADIIVFTDANVMLASDILDRLQHHFSDAEIGCVCGNLTYTNASQSITASTGGLYWRFEQWLKSLEQQSGSIMGADGSLFAVRRSLHQPPPDHIIDDMYVSFMVLCSGFRIVQAADVCAYEQSAVSATDEFKRKMRIACQAFNVHRLIWPQVRALDGMTIYKYLSHKFLRWITFYFIVLASASFGAVLLYSGDFGIVLGALVGSPIFFALSLRFKIPIVSRIADVMLSFVATALGVWRSLRGDLFQIWTPVSSVRKL